MKNREPGAFVRLCLKGKKKEKEENSGSGDATANAFAGDSK